MFIECRKLFEFFFTFYDRRCNTDQSIEIEGNPLNNPHIFFAINKNEKYKTKFIYRVHGSRWVYLSKHVCPMLGQRQPNIGPTLRVCWDHYWSHGTYNWCISDFSSLCKADIYRYGNADYSYFIWLLHMNSIKYICTCLYTTGLVCHNHMKITICMICKLKIKLHHIDRWIDRWIVIYWFLRPVVLKHRFWR